jgi:hypothetical protein
MRTTLTIDDDVAATLERLRRAEDKSLKELVNQALRRGLKDLAAPVKPREPFRTRSVSVGRCLIGNLDDISEVLAIAEGENYR